MVPKVVIDLPFEDRKVEGSHQYRRWERVPQVGSRREDIIGPLPFDRQLELIIIFVDCFSKYTILVLSRNHTAMNVCNVLLNHIIPYFGVLCHLLSDHKREFTSQISSELLNTLGI